MRNYNIKKFASILIALTAITGSNIVGNTAIPTGNIPAKTSPVEIVEEKLQTARKTDIEQLADAFIDTLYQGQNDIRQQSLTQLLGRSCCTFPTF